MYNKVFEKTNNFLNLHTALPNNNFAIKQIGIKYSSPKIAFQLIFLYNIRIIFNKSRD